MSAGNSVSAATDQNLYVAPKKRTRARGFARGLQKPKTNEVNVATTANIVEPNRLTEFEVQAWLYSALQAAGFNVRGEVVAKTGEARRGFKFARFDLVIFRNGIPQMIIEVKDKPRADGQINYSGRQYKKYVAFGIPLAYARGMDEAKALYERLVGEGTNAVTVEQTPDAEALRTPNGGYTRETLEKLGVPWPPPKGWKKELEARYAVGPQEMEVAK